MNKVILAAALICLFLSMYYFFFERNLFLGSITIILSLALNLIFAAMNKVDKLDGNAEKK